MTNLTDSFQRKFSYIRLSITDLCNFRCQYCLPQGYQKKCEAPTVLSYSELRNLLNALTQLGVQKIRLSGGEPTLRSDLVSIIRLLKEFPQLETIALTTNGYRLQQQVEKLHAAGLNALNVSVDSLDAQKFEQITGHHRLPQILAGIKKALDLGFASIKVNTVLLKGVNHQEFPEFLKWIQSNKISVRFIELMQTKDNAAYFQKHHISAEGIRQYLLALGFSVKKRALNDGPAFEYTHPDYRGSVGLIMPYSQDFCHNCNRLRISAQGQLYLCLFGEQAYDLRPLLQNKLQLKLLKTKMQQLLLLKPPHHFLAEGNSGALRHLSVIGG